ncbi:MAG: hypothetical protein ABS68_14100 [Niastella sp. SCN 39-18]|nr:MAG: hypothetical protein ABS68_14100 [Niastella sp. SCN 39-18]OJW10973.1 MAG: hypothetical protein BGO53_01230 [Sphingobacteriales bacterium 39-19]
MPANRPGYILKIFWQSYFRNSSLLFFKAFLLSCNCHIYFIEKLQSQLKKSLPGYERQNE